jgi:signal transduction histidine kinase
MTAHRTLPVAWPHRALSLDGDRLQSEQLLATVRLILPPLVVWVSMLDQPESSVAFSPLLVASYTAFAAAIVILIRVRPAPLLRWRTAFHGADFAFASAIAMPLPGTMAPYWLLWMFVLLGAALRWGVVATLLTGAGLLAAYVGEAWISTWKADAELSGRHLLASAVYLAAASMMVALLAATQTAVASETRLLARILIRIRRGRSVSEILQHALEDYRAFAGASGVLLAVEDTQSGHLFVEMAASPSVRRTLAPTAADRDTFFFAIAPSTVAWRAVTAASGRIDTSGFGATESLVHGLGATDAHARLLTRHAARTFLAVQMTLPGWRVRLFTFDPARARVDDLRLLYRLSAHVAPALHDRYLVSRLRNQAGATERARIARELHDGLIQQLIGVEMEIDALTRRGDGAPLASELGGIGTRLHDAILDTRDLMAALKSADLPGQSLITEVRALVDRFHQDTGVHARLRLDVDVVDAPARQAREIARIVREALVNVRKHSGARHVIVRFAREDDCWLLVIDDDGCGFAFEGRRSQPQLDSEKRGPVVIKERVRAIGGELVIESQPGHGARLEIRWPVRSTDT